MKKIILMLGLAFLGFNSVYGQGFKLGVNAGIPVGDVEEFSTFQLGFDAAYLYPVSELFSVGALAGYSRYFGDEISSPAGNVEVDDFSFLPIAATARFGFSDFLFVGGDLGYAIGLNESDGGIYYRPKVGYGLGPLAIIASFSGISVDGGDVSSVNLGVEFGF